jgi:hypothetical protein
VQPERNQRLENINHGVNGVTAEITFFHVASSPRGPGLPHYQGFTIKLRHITIGITPLEEGSASRRVLYLTTHNAHKRETSMSSARIKPAIPAS